MELKKVPGKRPAKVRDKKFYVKKLQVIFNRFIRLRDKADPCISCGKQRDDYHAGHYLSVGSHNELRFCEDNVHKQCAYCNFFLSGNLLNYRKGLINKIGLSKVDFLESKHEQNKYSIDDLKRLMIHYTNLIKSMEAV